MSGGVSLNDVDTLFEHISSCTVCESLLDSIRPARLESDLVPIVKEFDQQWKGDTNDTSLVDTNRKGFAEERQRSSSSEDFELPNKIGKYKVVKKLSQGAFGVVCRASDPILNREVAIKIPRPDRFETREQIEEFISEARTTANIEHKNIVTIYDADVTQSGLAYIVMKWVDGETLESLVARKKLSVDEVCALMIPICDAVHYANKQGFIHRDLKPANILVDQSGTPFVADFGLALHEENLGGRRGEFAGTLAYMAPEQISGKVDIIDARADVWSLGVILYELLAGRRPFQGSRSETLIQIREKSPTSIRMYNEEVSEELELACMLALEKSCDARIKTAKDLATRIERGLSPAASGTRNYYVQYGIGVASFLLLCVIGFQFFPLSGAEPKNGSNNKADVDSQKMDGTHWLVEPIYFPNRETCRWEIKDNELTIQTDAPSLFSLYDAPGESFDLELDFFQPGWTGGFAVVIGNDGRSFEKLQFNAGYGGNDYYYSRVLVSCDVHPTNGSSRTISYEKIGKINDGFSDAVSFRNLKISVVDGQLAKLQMGNREFAKLIKHQEGLPSRSIGIFLDRSFVSIRNIRLNGQKIKIFSTKF